MRAAFFVSALAFVVPVFSVPTIVPITKHAGPINPDSYIVKLKDNASRSEVLGILSTLLKLTGSLITHDQCELFPGFTGILKGDALTFVQRMQQVEYIEQDSIISLAEHEAGIEHDHSPPMAGGHHDILVDRTGGSESRGEGVTVYGIDTGIYTEHHCFEGRASHGASFVDKSDGDGDMNGHGTHTAATAVCKGYGVATEAKVIAVKVLDGTGSGSTSGVIAGVCWAFKDFKKKGMKPSIATMSLGGLPSLAMNYAVSKAIEGGLHFTAAAGNSNQDAIGSSPANVEKANTVGAVDMVNKKASFSNYGPLLDVWALGVNVTSAWIGNPTAKNTISGTSMATPQVAGILAVAISRHGNKSPKELSDDLKAYAEPIVTGAPLGTTNKLAIEW